MLFCIWMFFFVMSFIVWLIRFLVMEIVCDWFLVFIWFVVSMVIDWVCFIFVVRLIMWCCSVWNELMVWLNCLWVFM